MTESDVHANRVLKMCTNIKLLAFYISNIFLANFGSAFDANSSRSVEPNEKKCATMDGMIVIVRCTTIEDIGEVVDEIVKVN